MATDSTLGAIKDKFDQTPALTAVFGDSSSTPPRGLFVGVEPENTPLPYVVLVDDGAEFKYSIPASRPETPREEYRTVRFVIYAVGLADAESYKDQISTGFDWATLPFLNPDRVKVLRVMQTAERVEAEQLRTALSKQVYMVSLAYQIVLQRTKS